MTLSTNIKTFLQIRIKFVPSYFNTGSGRFNKITSGGFCASDCTYMNNPHTMLFFYLHKSSLSFLILTLAPTNILFRIFTLQIGKKSVRLKSLNFALNFR